MNRVEKSKVALDLVSPLLAGRETELNLLTDTLETVARGVSRFVLIGAEAGGGKSRLVREFASQVQNHALVLVGACVEQRQAGLPYAPFAAMIREIARIRGTSEIENLLGSNRMSELARLLPMFGRAATDTDPDLARARLFETIRDLIECLAGERPLVLILEDAHWADSSTRDLLVFLSRNLQGTPVLVLITYRIDELRPDDPLRRVLAEVSRTEVALSLQLPRLSRTQVAAQLQGMLGHSPSTSLVLEVLARGAGIPLFTEALIGPDQTVRAGVPGSLRDLLLTVVRDLPESTQQLLRIAALGGTRISHTLLAAVASRNSAAVAQDVRSATDLHVLITDGDGYAFRHALFREVVDEDMLAGERAALHRSFAEALEADRALAGDAWRAILLARHWYGANEPQRALIAAWDAASEAAARLAYPEQLQMLEQVLALWDQVPAAAAYTGTDPAGVLALAADAACWAVEPQRGMALVERALDALKRIADNERTAAMLLQRAVMRQQRLLPGQVEDLMAALDLVPEPSPLRAETLAQLCRALLLNERNAEAGPLATELSVLAAGLEDDEYTIESRITLAQLEGDGTAPLDDAIRASRERNLGRVEMLAYAALLHALANQGQYSRAIETSRTALRRAQQLGQARYIGATIAQFMARSLTAIGRWDEALDAVDSGISLDPGPLGRAQLLPVRGQIAAARGDLPDAWRVIEELRTLMDGTQAKRARALALARLEIDARLVEGDATAATAVARSTPILGAGVRDAWPFLAVAARAVGAHRDGDDFRHTLAAIAEALPRPGPVDVAYAAMCAAELADPDRLGHDAEWDAVANLWADLGQPYEESYARLRSATASIRHNRERAATQLREASRLAASVNAQPLLTAITSLARRARLDAPGAATASAPDSPHDLTKRERDVLSLLALGRSNRDIAEELFISVKTVSVHVSNILAKLQVPNRSAAAALVHSQRLLDPPYGSPDSSG